MGRKKKDFVIENDTLYLMDCLDGMRYIADKSVDAIITDLPYSTTCNEWDNIIPFDKLWKEYKRIIKDNGAIVLFATQPFTTHLMMSNMDMWRYNWIWKKDGSNGFLNANYAPLKQTEDICVFSHAKVGSLSKNKIVYYPQGVIEVNKTKVNNPNNKYRASQGYTVGGNALNNGNGYTQKYENYPTNILEFSRDKESFHPTQKPVKLLEYLVRTYTNEGELVLDSCMGSGTTALACLNTNRRFVGFETNKEYFDIANERIKEVKNQEKLF